MSAPPGMASVGMQAKMSEAIAAIFGSNILTKHYRCQVKSGNYELAQPW